MDESLPDQDESVETVVSSRCPLPAGHGPMVGTADPGHFGLVHAPLQPMRSGSPFRAAMGDELGRKAAVGLFFLGSGALVVVGLALAGWLIMRVVRVRMAERKQRAVSAREIGIREIGSPTRTSDEQGQGRTWDDAPAPKKGANA